MTEITRDELQQIYDIERESRKVSACCLEAAEDLVTLLRFLGRYATWNSLFGAGVAALAGKLGRSRRLFLDAEEPVHAIADRSVLVASYFFDAARDEFDDRATPHRDTHRCLAQAMLKGIIQYGSDRDARLQDAQFVNVLFQEPMWLWALTTQVAIGYGVASPDDLPALFRAMGYHLGSEVLADREFSLIDAALKARQAELTTYLTETRVNIAGRAHAAYQWLTIHSGHGGAVEADHFAWATRGACLAFGYVNADMHAALRRELHLGFQQFTRDHQEFFANVNAV